MVQSPYQGRNAIAVGLGQITDTMAKKTIKLDKRNVPVEDILEMKLVCVSDTLYTQVRYQLHEPMYHIVETLVPRDKAYDMEKTVRLAMERRQRGLG